MYSVRTDLAIEAAAIYNKTKQETSKLDGVIVKTAQEDTITITRVEVTNQNGAKAVGKPIGTYITI